MIRAALFAVLFVSALPVRVFSGAAMQPLLGTSIDPKLTFTDTTGRQERLAGFIGGKPTLVLPGYHRCPSFCGVAERDLAEALAATRLPSNSYTVLFASIDPTETPADAMAARARLAEAAPDADLGSWHFLTAGNAAVATGLESALGLSVLPKEGGLYVHPIAVAALTADGRLSRVLSGLDYQPRDLRLAIIEASQNRLGALGEHILLLCGGFDPVTGRYTGAVMIGVRAGGVLALLVLAGGLMLLARRGRA